MAANKAVFLDRDGVINELVYHQEQEVIDSPFTVRQFKLIQGVTDAIKRFQQNQYLVVVTSNQPGVAKGHMTEMVFAAIREKMKSELWNSGIKLDGEYYCLHHTEAKKTKYRVKCNCRKPEPGLLQQAARDLDIDLNKSWIVGDNLSDIAAGKAVMCKTLLLGNMKCETCRLMEEKGIYPDFVKSDLSSATGVILEENETSMEVHRFHHCHQHVKINSGAV